MPHVAGDEYEQQIEVLGGNFYGGDWGSYVAPGNPYTVGALYNPVSEPPRYRAPPEIFPTVRIVPPPEEAPDSASPGTEAVPQVISPDVGTRTTVFEEEDEPWMDRTRPTDWDYVYDQYVILNAPEADVPFHDSIDWGEIAGSVIGGIFDPFGYGAQAQAAFSPPGIVGGMQQVPNLGGGGPPAIIPPGGAMAAACGPTGPRYGKVCLATGVITPLRRRRRRRLLTSSDIKDLAALKSIVGGAALQGAVVQAIRR